MKEKREKNTEICDKSLDLKNWNDVICKTKDRGKKRQRREERTKKRKDEERIRERELNAGLGTDKEGSGLREALGAKK